MLHHRLTSLMTPAEPDPLPVPPPVSTSSDHFVACPAALLQGFNLMQMCWQMAIYQRALAEAQAVVRPSLPERDLLGFWN